MYSFSYLEPACCSISSSNLCFLICTEVSQEAGQLVWYSHLFQNFSQFIVIHTVEGFGIFNKAEIDIFLELSCSFDDPSDVGNLISDSSAFSKISLNIWKSMGLSRHKKLSGIPCPSPGGLPNPGIKPRSPTLQQILHQLSHQGSPRTLEWEAVPFSRGSSQPRDRTQGSHTGTWSTIQMPTGVEGHTHGKGSGTSLQRRECDWASVTAVLEAQCGRGSCDLETASLG